MDPIALLKSDHRRLKDLFKQIQQRSERKFMEQTLRRIEQELDIHTQLEETIFYPACETYPQMQPLVLKFYDDHLEIEDLMHEVGGVAPGGENKRLNDLVRTAESHLDEEEERLFPLVHQLMDRAALSRLGQELETASGQLRMQQRSAGAR